MKTEAFLITIAAILVALPFVAFTFQDVPPGCTRIFVERIMVGEHRPVEGPVVSVRHYVIAEGDPTDYPQDIREGAPQGVLCLDAEDGVSGG